MNTKAIILALSALLCGATHAADVLEGDFATITIGTNIFTNAHLRAYSLTEGSLRHDGGVEKFELADLPEPARSKFYNPWKAEADAKAKEEAAVARAALAEAGAKAALEAECNLKAKRLGLPYHPYRKVGQRTYDLRRLYREGLPDPAVSGNSLGGKKVSEDFPGWVVAVPSSPPLPSGGWMENGLYSVVQVTAEGLLVEHTTTTHSPYGSIAQSAVYFLSNYPFANSVADGQAIAFIAIRAGNHKYVDTQGAARTVLAFDYGIPCDASGLPVRQQSGN